MATSSLGEYLAPFRNGDESLLTPVEVRGTGWRDAKGKSRVYYLLKDSLPPRAFEQVVTRSYYGLQAAAGRNPGRGRVLPDLLIIGAAKCGTTSLFDWICEHPLIVRPQTNGRMRKELLFLDYHFTRGIDWYRSHFPLASERAAFAREHGQPFLTGEATASYLTSYWVPERAAKLLPETKLIVTLRNPVDRAFSAYQMSRRELLERSERFETAIALEDDRLAPLLERVRRDPYYNPPLPPPLGYWSYLHRSRYAEHVERWFKHVPRERFLFLSFEELAAEPQRTLDSVYSFLGLPPHTHAAFRTLNAGNYAQAMNPQTRAQLAEYFRPHNERLRQLTGVDYAWDR